MTAQKIKHNPRLFLQRAMEIQRRQLLLAMADAVSECRTAEGMAAELNRDGETLIADIDRHFQEVCKERGIDLESGQEQDAGIQPIQTESPQTGQENHEAASEPEPSWKIPTELPEQDPSMFRYYITQKSLNVGTYPLMDGKTITELAAPVKVEQDSLTVFGCIDYPQPLTAEQEREYALLPASQNPQALDSIGHAAEAAQLCRPFLLSKTRKEGRKQWQPKRRCTHRWPTMRRCSSLPAGMSGCGFWTQPPGFTNTRSMTS